jgi:DNA mismatch repair protein MutS
MQIGSFFEVYQYSPHLDTTGEPLPPEFQGKITGPLGKAEIVSSMLHILLTMNEKSKPHSFTNPFMAGFQFISYEKYRGTLIEAGYTVVRVEQKKTPKGADIERYVAGIDSIATVIEHIPTTQVSSYIVCIYIEIHATAARTDEYTISLGSSVIDVTLGKSVVMEACSDHLNGNPSSALQELSRFLLAHRHREIVIYLRSLAKNCDIAKYREWLLKNFDFYKSVIVFQTVANPEYFKNEYHEGVLRKVFSTSQPIIEHLGLERMYYGTISYILLLQYCYEHNETLIKQLQLPETTWSDDRHLILTDDVASQLNIMPNGEQKHGEIDSLFSVIDNTSTSIGNRYLHMRLCNPLTDVDLIKSYLDMTEELIAEPELLTGLETRLKRLPDIVKLQRKLLLSKLRPAEFSQLFYAYIDVIELYRLLSFSKLAKMKNLLFKGVHVTEFNECMNLLNTLIDFEQLKHCSIYDNILESESDQLSFFRPAARPHIDSIQTQITQLYNHLIAISQHLHKFMNNRTKIELTYEKRSTVVKRSKKLSDDDLDVERVGIFVTISSVNMLKKHISEIDTGLCGSIEFVSRSKSVIEITSPVIKYCCETLETLLTQLETLLYDEYMAIIRDMAAKNFYTSLTQFIGQVDFIKSNAKTALKNKYYKPTVLFGERSFVKIDECRHPIVEKLIDNEYVKNDIEINREQVGILLYGCNSTGKTSLAKSIGLNVVLAQAGCYVAGKMTLSPYKRIVMRLRGDDNMFKGKSSFNVEMTELRTILRYIGENTLVLGDELCRGTEQSSGGALTMAALEKLCQTKTSFIFSTHMHQLMEMGVEKLPMRICHLSVDNDADGLLVYTRKLEEGSGESIYGIKVAQSLKLDEEFIKRANEIRRKYEGRNEILSSRRSRYNASLYVDACQMCGASFTDTNLETHHIRPQKSADDQGFIGDMHKNVKGNLMVLCDKCHDNLHKTA